MGKRIISQRRGRGTFTYKSHSHRHKGKIENYSKTDIKEGKITDIIHNPGHNAPCAIIKYDKDTILIPAYEGMKVGETVIANGKEISKGNLVALKDIPEGTSIYNIEGIFGKPMFCRTAGSFARVVSKSKETVTIKLPSKSEKVLDNNLRAMIGIVAGSGKNEKPFAKAGKMFMKMKASGKLYPRTSGVAMNAVDHPFGSGRGRHIGKSKNAPRFAPPGRKVGLIKSRRSGRRK